MSKFSESFFHYLSEVLLTSSPAEKNNKEKQTKKETESVDPAG